MESNDSLNNTDWDNLTHPLEDKLTRITIIFCYSIVCCCCFFGNLLVLFVVLRWKKMRTITNFFLANLAVADFCVSIFCIIPNLLHNIYLEWYFGEVMCKFNHFIQQMSYTASVTILTVISAERYFAIIYPMKSKQVMTLPLLRVVIIIVWVLSAGASSPTLFFFAITETAAHQFCFMTNYRDILAIINFSFYYLIPLLLMSFAYCHISLVLWRTSRNNAVSLNYSRQSQSKRFWRKLWKKEPKRNDDSPVPSPHPEHTDDSTDETLMIELKALQPSPNRTTQKAGGSAEYVNKHRKPDKAVMARRKVIRLLVVVVLSFAFCVFPYHLRILRSVLYSGHEESLIFTPISFIFYYLNSALNPILYALLSENFRKAMKEVVMCWKPATFNNPSGTMQTVT